MHRRYKILVVLGLITMNLSSLSWGDDEKDRDLEKLKREELKRRHRVYEWAREKQASQQAIMRRLLQPILEGNKEDYTKNMRLAQRFRKRAESALDQRREDTAKEYMQAAQLFYQLAQTNSKIVKHILNQNGAELNSLFADIQEIESSIFQLTEKRPAREWFTPDELRAASLSMAKERNTK
ncbi:MAG: hypothetical protein K9N51_04675 [Candidatus Pacebacteria bacterium]|nr:hypothetical protein [Candidatus Paceibacterota bacterium]